MKGLSTEQNVHKSMNIVHDLATLARGAISSINAHHMRLVKLFSFNLVCPKIILREYFWMKFY